MIMRRFLSALAALLITSSAYAAFGIFQTYAPSAPSRVQKNLVSDYGAVCDGQYASPTITTNGTGNRNVFSSLSIFSSGDVGKTIAIGGVGAGGSTYTGTIASFTNAQNIVVGSDISTPKTAQAADLVWATDATAAYTAFKAAYQGTTPVQLNLPGFCGITSAQQFPFKGIGDLVVAGNGSATSGISSLAGGMLLGGSGQFNDAFHSNRTDTINPGDSCITLKTPPAVTVTGIQPSFASTARFSASSSGTTMTVNSITSGTIVPGAIIGNATSNAGSFNTVQPYGTAGTTGVGGTGTYAMSASVSFALQATYTAPASYTGSIAANTGVLTVTSVEDGVLAVGQVVYGGGSWNGTGASTSAPTNIVSQIAGTPGGAGTYQLSNRTTSGGSGKYQSQGNIRVSLNSTTGLTTGDTLFLNNIVGQGLLPQRSNGLFWIKVINGTDVDLFQMTFDGAYTSGGTGGGDRTALFPVGSKIMVGGWANQAYYGAPYSYPSNPHWFEYRTVVSVNSTTHQVCVDAPFANLYKDTWPQYNTGRNVFEVDQGGPATIYVLDPTWETTVEFKDLSLVTPNGQTTSNGRNITWRDAKMVGVHCAIPTQNVTHNWINVDASTCSIETDKIVGTWNITGGSIKKINVQSSSIDTINIDGTTMESWFGSPKKLNITNSTATSTIQVGTLAYGVSDESICTNCTTPDFTRNTPVDQVDEASHPWSMSGGIITIPNAFSASGCCQYAETQTRLLVPGHYVAWQGGGGGGTVAQAGRFFKVLDVTQDTVNTYVQTSEAGGFPTGAWTTNSLKIFPHPAPKLTVSFTGGSGNNALALNGCPAQAPMFSCQNFTYTGSATGGSTPGYSPTIWGVLDTFTFTNNVPFTGGGALGWTVTRFANWQVLKTDLTTTTFGATNMINTKLPTPVGGTRTLTPSGATGTQSLDSLTAPPTDAWFGGNGQPIFTANTPSDSPQVTMTLRTDQQLP